MTFLTTPEPADDPLPIWPAAVLTLASAGAFVALVAMSAIYGA